MTRSDYFIRNEIAFFIVERSNKDFIFRFVNQQYSRFMKLDHPLALQHTVHELMPTRMYQEFSHYCSLLNEDVDCIEYSSEDSNSYSLPLSYTLYSFQIDDRHYIACSISSSEAEIYEFQPSRKPVGLLSLFQDNYNLLTSLTYSEQEKKVLINLNSALCDYLNISKCEIKNACIKESFPEEVSRFLLSGFIQCIKTGYPINRQLLYHCTENDNENFFTPEDGIFFLNITFVPNLNKSSLSCSCYARDVSKKTHHITNGEELLLEYDTLFNSSTNAIAICTVADNYELKMEKYNKRMEVFLNRFPDLLVNLIESNDNFISIINERTPFETLMTLNVRGDPYHIQVSIVPVVKHFKVIKLIITLLTVTSAKQKDNKPLYNLTRREQEIVSLVSQGRKNEYIANKLNISTGTVKKTLSNVYKKLSINSRVELVKYYLKDNK